MAIFDLGAILYASEGNGLTFTAILSWLECLIAGVNILQKKDKPFPNADVKKQKLFPKYHA